VPFVGKLPFYKTLKTPTSSTYPARLNKTINVCFHTSIIFKLNKTIEKYIRFVNGDIILGEEGKSDIITLRISNDRIQFLDGGKEVAYFSNKKLHVTDVSITTSLQIGPFKIVPRTNGNTSIIRERGVG
jgi:hypothetical protein